VELRLRSSQQASEDGLCNTLAFAGVKPGMAVGELHERLTRAILAEMPARADALVELGEDR